MEPETVTVMCSTHRRRIRLGEGRGIILVHDGGNVDPYCSSARFTIRTERVAGREDVHATLTALGRDGG